MYIVSVYASDAATPRREAVAVLHGLAVFARKVRFARTEKGE